MCLIDCGKEECSEVECKCGPLLANSIDYSAAKDLSYADMDLDTPDMRDYVTGAFRTAMGEGLMQYFEKSMRKQRKAQQDGSPGGALYQVDTPPLKAVRASRRRAQILTMRTFDRDEASIAGTIDVLKDICDELKILKHDDDDSSDEGVEVEGVTVRRARRGDDVGNGELGQEPQTADKETRSAAI